MGSTSVSILVVDDEADSCKNLSDIFTDFGYRVDVAYDGAAALELLRKTSYDVALLDLKMPGMDGLTLYREIKKMRADTVAIIVTAYASSATAEAALEAGAWKIVAKPVDVQPLLEMVEGAAAQPLVMIVDDDHDLCENLWQILRDRGYRVGLAHNEREAEQRLRETDFKVVLIDMKLPDGDGSRVFRLVRQSSPTARTILITGFRTEMDQLIQQIVTEGADDVCYKPFDVDQLIAKIEHLAGNHHDSA